MPAPVEQQLSSLKTLHGQVAFVQEERAIKPVTLASNSIVMLYKYGSLVYCSAPNSTAFQFPLTDARIHERAAWLLRLSRPESQMSRMPTSRSLLLQQVWASMSRYPEVSASACAGAGKPAIEVPLDGTVYDLASGKVGL